MCGRSKTSTIVFCAAQIKIVYTKLQKCKAEYFIEKRMNRETYFWHATFLSGPKHDEAVARANRAFVTIRESTAAAPSSGLLNAKFTFKVTSHQYFRMDS